MLKKAYIKLFDDVYNCYPTKNNSITFNLKELNFDELQKCYSGYNYVHDIEIGITYLLYELTDNKKQIITCSVKDMRTYVMNLIYLWFKDRKKSILNKFDNINDVSIILHAHNVYKNVSYDEIIKIKNGLTEKFNKKNIDDKKLDNIKNNIEYLKRLLEGEIDRKLNTYYIYKFFGNDNKDIYIFQGEKKKSSIKDIFKLFDDYDFK